MAERHRAGLTRAEGRRFGLTLSAAFTVIAVGARLRGHPHSSGVATILASLLLIAGFVVPTKLGPMERAWMRFGEALSVITTPVFLGIVYFLVLTPLALLRRAMGKNEITRNRDSVSFWFVRNRSDRTSMERQF